MDHSRSQSILQQGLEGLWGLITWVGVLTDFVTMHLICFLRHLGSRY